jgi:hypothetical protein
MTGTAPRRAQCAKCPWKKGTDPHQIPDGYRVEKHRALANTIAEPGVLRPLNEPTRMFACHETTGGDVKPCVGWLAHQLGPGNNIALRLKARNDPDLTRFELVGPQHERFEDTLPKKRKRARR